MSQRIIEVPGRGSYKFPSSMTDEEIAQAFQDNFPEWFNDQGPAYGPEELSIPGISSPSRSSFIQEEPRRQTLNTIKEGKWEKAWDVGGGVIDSVPGLEQELKDSGDAVNNLQKMKLVMPTERYSQEIKSAREKALNAADKYFDAKEQESAFRKRFIPSEEEYQANLEATKTYNASNPNDRKLPETIAWEDEKNMGKFFMREGDGFDDLRKDLDQRDWFFQDAYKEAMNAPDDLGEYWAKRLPVAGGIVELVQAFEKRGYAKLLEGSPPPGFADQAYNHGDYLVAIKEMAKFAAWMEKEEGKSWWHGEGWEDASSFEGLGFLGRKGWDILSAAPGFAAEFMLTGGVASAAKVGVTKGAKKLIGAQARRQLSKSLAGMAAKTVGKAGRFTAAATAQTAASSWLISRNFAQEIGKDVTFETDPATGNMKWKVDGIDWGGDLQRAFAYSVAEIGSERLGESLMKMKTVKGLSNAFSEFNMLQPGKSVKDFNNLMNRAGYQGPGIEVLEERANELATYLYDVADGEEGFTTEALSRRFTTPWGDEGRWWAEYASFMMFGAGMKTGQAVATQAQQEALRRQIGHDNLLDARNKWDANKADEKLNANPDFTGLRDHTGRVLLFEDSNGNVLPVIIGDSKDELTSSLAATMAQNSDLSFRGAFHLKAGKPSEVVNATWEQADGPQAHTFNSMDDVRSHSKALVEAGNKQAARQIMTQAYEQLAPKPEVNEVELDDTTVDRVRLGKSRVKLADVERLTGGKVTETDNGYRVDVDGNRLDINFNKLPFHADQIIESALEEGGITQEQVDQADTVEKREALARSVESAGLFTIEVNGEKASPYWLIQLDLNADMNTFRHEMVHYMKAAGIISPAQWARLEDEAKSIPGEGRLEEKIAYMIENRIDNPMPGESKIVHNVVRLLDKLRNMTRFLNSRALWRGMESGALARGAQAQAPGEAVQEYSVQPSTASKKTVARQVSSGRQSGAVLDRAILPQDYVPKYLKEGMRILDAGAGQHAKFAEGFRQKGYQVDAYDLPENMVEGLHQKDWAKRKHDIGYSSRVLNVMDSRKDMNGFIGRVAGALTKSGKYLVNIPDSPRYGAFKGKSIKKGDEMVKRVLLEHFDNVEEIGEKPHRKSSVLLASGPVNYSIQGPPKGFKDLQDWEGFLRQSNNQGRWVTPTTEGNLRAPGDAYEAMISIRDGAENKAVAEMADVIADTVKDQPGRTSGFLMAGKRDDGMSSNALGTYWTQDDEVRLLKTERPRDLITIHEVVHSFTAMAARQYTHGATDSKRTVGKSYLKRLGNLRDQIMKGERVVGTKPDYNLKRDVMKWVEVKEKIRPSGKDLAIANLIDLYLEGVEKIGPEGLVSRKPLPYQGMGPLPDNPKPSRRSRKGTAGRARGKGSPSRELGRHHYGWSNLMEFTAEAMSNPAFQAQLLSIDKGPAVNYRSWMTNGAKERDRMAKAARGIFEQFTSVAMHPWPQPESVIKTAQGRHTMLDAVAHAVADFGGIAKPSVEDYFKSLRPIPSIVNPQAGPRYPQYSVQANQEYMEAAEAGNLEEAENMVAQAAKAAGYTIGPVWHGSRSEKKFNEFDTFAGAYFTTDNDFAEGYRDAGGFFDEKGPMYNVYIKPGKSRTLDGEDSEAFEKFTGIRNESSELVRQGINSEILKFADGEFDIRVTDPSQIKSADPITKDDDGNIIPLSERFQTESDDIRYSVQGEQYVSNVLSNTGKFGDMYSRVVKAVKDMDMKKGTVQQWVGRLKKLSEMGGRPTPKKFRMGQSESLNKAELEELGIDDIFSPGTELTKEELLKFIEDAPVPEITFEPLGIAATQGTKWEGMELEQLQELEKIQWAEVQHQAPPVPGKTKIGGPASEEANELSDIIERYKRGIDDVGWNFPEMKTTQAHGAISMQSPSAEGYVPHVPNYGKGVVAWSRFNVGQDQWDFIESQSDLHQGASKAGYAPTKKGLKKWANTKWVSGLGTRLDPQGTQAAAENARELVQKAQAEIDELKTRLSGVPLDGELIKWAKLDEKIGKIVSENYYRLKQFESNEQADASNGESAWGSIELWTWPTSNGVIEQWQIHPPNFNDIGSSETIYSSHNTFEEAVQAWKDNIGAIMSGFGEPNAVHKKSWHEANFRAVVQMAALHGAKKVAFPSKWQQVAEIEGHSQAGEKPTKDRAAMYSRMVKGTLAEAKRLAKKYGSKVVKTKAIGTVAHGGTASLKEYYYENIDELLEIIDVNDSHFNHILDEQAAPGMDAAWPWQEVRDAMVDGDMEIEEAWRNALEETDRGGLEYAVDALIDSNDLMSLKHPNGGTVLDFQKKQTPPSRDLLALEVTPEMAGPMARYSVQGNWGLNILKGKAKPEGLPKNPTIMDVAHMFQDAFDSPIIYQEDDPRQNARVEASLENEIKHAYKLHPEAAGWYDENLSLAVSVLKEADPEIVKPANKFIFGATLAITSDGNKVDGQFGQAWDIYQEWKKTGKLNPKLAFGDRQGNIRKNLVAAMGMFEKYGPEKATEMLIQVRSVGGHVDYMVNELGIDKKIANDLKGKVGELVSSEVPFAAMMFGPKLGSFFSNLEGDYSNITMDRWFMRTIGRLTGTYLKPVDLNAPRGTKAKPKPSALDRLRQAIRAISSEERKELGINTRSASGEKGAIDTAKKMSRYFGHPKLGAKRRGPGVKAGGSATWNEARNSANSIVVLLKPVVDTPENGSHRAWIRTRMNNVRVKLASQGIHLENADIQALLWYSEKELYDKLGIKGPKGANDYASASEGVHRRVRGRPSRSYARGTGQVGGIGSGRPGKKGSGVGDFSVQSDQVSPEAQARINHIEAGGSYHAPPPEAAPAYGSSYISDFQKRHFARPSQKLVYFAGSKVGEEKTRLQIEEAYAAAAVRKAQVEVSRQLTDQAYKAQSGLKLPKWMNTGKWAKRLNEFMDKSVHLAAHLNATSRDTRGNLVFTDFEMRAGLMKEKEFNKGSHQVGDRIIVINPLTQENDELAIGSFITTPDGRSGYQLLRVMEAARQEEIYNHFKTEYPDLIWSIDMYIDPALKDTREVINGVEVPAFNRFSLERLMEEADPAFEGVPGYTPDVMATRSLIGGILGLFNPGAGSRSPGRKYKTGKARESGLVQDLFSGHSIRAFQAIQEKHRQRFRDIVLRDAAVPLEQGESPENLPEGWVMLDTGMNDLIQRVKKFRGFIEEETIDGTEFYRKFVGELYAKRGRQLKIRKEAVEVLMQQYIRIQFNNRLYNMGGWMVRNSKAMLLAHPGTMFVNAATNDLFTFEKAFQEMVKGVSLLPTNPTEGKISLRMSKELMVGNFLHRFPSLRKMAGLTSYYDEVVEEAIPEEIFAGSVSLQDLDVKYEVGAGQYLREGEIGAASLQLLQYGNIDVRAKQRMTYAFLKAHAVQGAKDQGLKGQALKDAVDRFMKNPPRDIMVKAVDAANLEYLNYADSPSMLQWFAATPYTALIMPFPRFGYHFMAKQITKAAAVKDVLGKVPAEKRADAFGKLMAFSMFGLGGTGLILDMLLRDDDDDDDEARERIGTSYIKYTDPVTGEVRTKQIERQMITTARVNLSWYAQRMGLGTESEQDFWWRVRNYPMIAMAGNAILAESDARNHGAWEGAKTYIRNTTDLSKDFFSLGAGFKVPSKVWAEIHSEPGRPKREPIFDPYATNVPLNFYLVEQSLTSFVPGTRQMGDLATLIQTDRPKKTASKTLGYEPGAWESIRANHLGAVLSRWAEKEGLIEPLPRQGSVVNMSLFGSRSDSLERRIQRMEGLGKLGGPESAMYEDSRSGKVRLATIPESSIPERTRSLELMRILGLNLKPVQRGAYEEQIRPLPQFPGTSR